jgi:glyoxylase-like metal-dependent hydrolase (beta-lactamase superfamily II)
VPLATLGACAASWRKDEEILLVCRSGARSGRAAQALVAAGFQKVMNLAGGMLALKKELAMHVEPFYDPRTSTLTYVVSDPTTKDAVVIDPVLDFDPASGRVWTESVDRVTEYLHRAQLRVVFVLETHAHADHLSGAQLLRRRFDARVGIGERIREVQEAFRPIFDLPTTFATDGRQFDRLLADGEIVRAGSMAIEVIATPGHTPACLTYRIGDAVFTGDALFTEDYGTGRTDFPRGSAEALYDSIQRLYALPDETRVFVGHDYQPGGRAVRWETTIGASKAKNPQLSATTTREAFVAARRARDATLPAPRLLYPSVQVNIDAGRLPPPHANGTRYLVLPVRGEEA